jgi:hypothetical protein
MPAIVIAAFLNPLKPSITAMRCFTPRWSCSIRLFRYFDERSFVSAGAVCTRARVEEIAIPTPVSGQLLLEMQYLSLDPYTRGRMA